MQSIFQIKDFPYFLFDFHLFFKIFFKETTLTTSFAIFYSIKYFAKTMVC